MVEEYVEKACDEIFKKKLIKKRLLRRFYRSLNMIQRTCALSKDGKQLVTLLLKS